VNTIFENRITQAALNEIDFAPSPIGDCMENEEKLERYRKAKIDYEEAKRVFKEISKIVADVSRCLETEPYVLTISGFGLDMPLSPEFKGKQLVCSPGQWPTEQDLAEALNRLYKTEKVFHKAWETLSPEEKKHAEAS
jgi:hypothetical protein